MKHCGLTGQGNLTQNKEPQVLLSGRQCPCPTSPNNEITTIEITLILVYAVGGFLKTACQAETLQINKERFRSEIQYKLKKIQSSIKASLSMHLKYIQH